MTKKYSTVARIFIDKNIHRTFTSSFATMGIALINVETDSLNTPNPRFVYECDLKNCHQGLNLVAVEFSVNKEQLHPNYFNESYSEPQFVMNKLTAPNFEECDKFVKAVKRIQASIKRKTPDIDMFQGCVTDYIEKLLVAAKVDAIWFENHSESICESRFKVYSPNDIEDLVHQAALHLK
ncbi:hypothetical protein [Photobacterium damselae]|uniref:hypothetical protein n=1 Tax=Photobacterium damselae TaxID=38293 RepID=UPI001F35384D|nr:hypothetical protein [Photobacterium damselae]UKA04910.1 hypothetical protein IHC89_21945 [Photobacterium damselae subsp. damselae]